jgi:hypothetical protein
MAKDGYHSHPPGADDMTTLQDAYAAKAAQALGLIEQLREKIEDLPAPDSRGINWGHVGDLCRMVDVLREALGEE